LGEASGLGLSARSTTRRELLEAAALEERWDGSVRRRRIIAQAISGEPKIASIDPRPGANDISINQRIRAVPKMQLASTAFPEPRERGILSDPIAIAPSSIYRSGSNETSSR
jgi:hypothetical protein